MQLMAIEFARNVLWLPGANSTEFDETTPYPVVNLMEEQKKIMNLGGTMRLGAQKMKINEGTKLYKIYDKTRFTRDIDTDTKWMLTASRRCSKDREKMDTNSPFLVRHNSWRQ